MNMIWKISMKNSTIAKKSGDYLYLLKQYNPRSAKYLLNLREQQLTKTAMTVPILTEDSTLTFIYLKPLKESL